MLDSSKRATAASQNSKPMAAEKPLDALWQKSAIKAPDIYYTRYRPTCAAMPPLHPPLRQRNGFLIPVTLLLSEQRGSVLDTYSKIIAKWVEQAAFDEIPDDVVTATKLRVLDVIGLSLAGGTTPFGASVRRAASLYPGQGSRLWGTEETCSVLGAALINGALSQALEYDDTHNESIVHMSSPSVAAALALVDDLNAGGRELITAVAISNEIACRAGSVAPSQFHKRGFHPSALFAPFGIACLGSSMLRLDADKIANALGIVGSFASGLVQCWVDGTQSKFLHPGWAAQSGIVAAKLAAEGATGPAEVFEGRWGLFASHLQTDEPVCDLGRLTVDLGNRWDSRNASFKPFPAAHVIHPYISAILRLRSKHALKPEQVARVICPVAPYIVGIVCEPLAEKRRPLTDSHGRVSLQFTLAEALVTGVLGRHSYAEQSLRDPVILSIADRIEYIEDGSLPGPEQFKGIVRIELTDGTVLEEIEEYNRGSAGNPMTEAEIVAKFRENTDGVLERETVERVIETALTLDQLKDGSSLTKLMIPALVKETNLG